MTAREAPPRLEGKVALVTGGASGIGLAIARRFVDEGARVMLADVDATGVRERAEEIGDAAGWVVADLVDEDDAQKMVAATVVRFGRLDVAVNSAGVGDVVPIVDQTVEQWDRVVGLDLRGVFVSIKHEARRMIEQGDGGVIVSLASINARQPAEGMSAYCSAKAGVAMLTQVAAMELAVHGIRVVALGPGIVETPLTTLLTGTPAVREEYLDNLLIDRIGAPEDIAAAAAFVVSDDASWMTGETLYVDGGSLTQRYPRLLHRLAEALAALEGG